MITDSAASGAVSARRMRFPSVAACAPCAIARDASSASKPPSEPMNMPAPFTSIVQSNLWGPRFEVLTTPEAVPGLFKIDKFTGDVWVLPNSTGSSIKLRKFTRETSFEDEVIEGQINYQLIVISTSKAYLLNLNSGVMWEYSEELFRTSRSFRLMEERF